MKIVSLVGSPHGAKGNTARLTRLVLDGAEKEGAKTETIYLRGGSVLPCRGCDNCHKKGLCPQKDEFESLQNKIIDADGLILASPNYIFSVSAQLKAFMDRCSCVIHCLRFEGKYGVSVVTSGGGDEEPITEYMNHFLVITGVRPVGSVWATMGNITGDSFPDDISRRAFELGRKLVKSWEQKITDPQVEEKMSAFRQRMQNLMEWRKDEWPYEYEYWQKHRRSI